MFDSLPKPPLSRRAFIWGAASLAAGVALVAESGLLGGLAVLGGATIQTTPGWVTLIKFDAAGRRLGSLRVAKIVKTEAQWRQQLPPLAFEVLRQGVTEIAFTGPLNDCYRPGVYRCLGCATALFGSQTKYDPHEGWPSFWAPLAHQNMTLRTDYSDAMVRTEVRCARCDGHLGHRFDDGPPPTGLRYCMDSAALAFRPRPVSG
ncbi:MAG: peptide-methionine (R)-S-oxide reductase MsrB [Terriglobales bacterium]